MLPLYCRPREVSQACRNGTAVFDYGHGGRGRLDSQFPAIRQDAKIFWHAVFENKWRVQAERKRMGNRTNSLVNLISAVRFFPAYFGTCPYSSPEQRSYPCHTTEPLTSREIPVPLGTLSIARGVYLGDERTLMPEHLVQRIPAPRQPKAQRGASVIELVIVLAVASIMAAMSVPLIENTTRTMRLNAAVSAVT